MSESTDPEVLRLLRTAKEGLSTNHEAIETNHGAIQAISHRVETLEIKVQHLEERVGRGLEDLAAEMKSLELQQGTTNAHLENVTREVAKTSAILETDFNRREEARKAQAEMEKNRVHTRNKVVLELWATFKAPIANAVTLLLAAGAAFFAWKFFGIPSAPTPVPVAVEQVGEVPVEVLVPPVGGVQPEE